jgi:hypothetical protein
LSFDLATESSTIIAPRAQHEVVALLWDLPGATQSFQQEEENTRCSAPTVIPGYSYRHRSTYRKGETPEAVVFGNATLMMMSWSLNG